MITAAEDSKPRILTIEDDAAIRRGIIDSLKASGYTVWQAGRADDGATMALQKPCDLVLLDLVLPGGTGLDVLAQIRRAKPTLPVIILTARGEERDRVHGLRLGADDYVVKPSNGGGTRRHRQLSRIAGGRRRVSSTRIASLRSL